jgi:hypothetical protein
MRYFLAVTLALGLALSLSPSAMAKGKKNSQPACLNALACGPQPVQQIRKPKNEKFMRSAG